MRRAAVRNRPRALPVQMLHTARVLRCPPPEPSSDEGSKAAEDAAVMASLLDKSLPHHKLEEELAHPGCAVPRCHHVWPRLTNPFVAPQARCSFAPPVL